MLFSRGWFFDLTVPDVPFGQLFPRNRLASIACTLQVKICYCDGMPKRRAGPKRRSACPLNASVEMLGDRWSLLILRDMMLRGYSHFHEFLQCTEKIATNILADRLRRLEDFGIIATREDPADGRKRIYSLTPKGIDLALVLTEMVLWAARHEDVGNQPLVRLMRADKEQFIANIHRHWADQHGTSSS